MHFAWNLNFRTTLLSKAHIAFPGGNDLTMFDAVSAAAPVALDFRHALRMATQDDHKKAENSFNDFLSAPAAHLRPFLTAQFLALSSLRNNGDDGTSPTCLAVLDDALVRLRADLCAPRGSSRVSVISLDPIAIDYLVLGSRLGVEVLRRRWIAEFRQESLPADFSQPEGNPAKQLWKDLCERLALIDPSSDQARRIILDSQSGYALFAQSANGLSLRG